MKVTPANRLRPIRFFTLAGVEDAGQQGNEIWGGFKSELTFSNRPVNDWRGEVMIQEFANWQPSPARIAVFTRKYGPLLIAPRDAAKEFRFKVDEWLERQQSFREDWETYARCGRKGVGVQFRVGVARGEAIHYSVEQFSYETSNLWRFLVFSLQSVVPERLRVCARPGCETPYFIARHLHQEYCSHPCAAWGQSKAKREWWARHGKEWRDRRSKKQRSSKNKARKRR